MPKFRQPDDDELAALGEAFDRCRRVLMREEEIGLTGLYNRFHNPEDSTEDLDALRAVQVQLDECVLALYGWRDIELEHAFRDVPYLPENDRLRFVISNEARLEILDRLGRLNRERYEQEVAEGLHGKQAQKKAQASKRPERSEDAGRPRAAVSDGVQDSLFHDGEDSE